ncbi:MAG: 4-oxalocrotonate tautomerase [Rhizobiales bacterium]|nr:4-oxalocrotonate tautomerase [Hyphomicrobiales bacterium]
MPVLKVLLTTSPDESTPNAVAVALTELTGRLLHKDRALTAVVIQCIDPDRWFVGGRRLSETDLASFALDIEVTAGTNTKAEIAAYIDAVFTRMVELIGPVHEASYITAHEVPASTWGYGGRTQEFRFIAKTIQKAA